MTDDFKHEDEDIDKDTKHGEAEESKDAGAEINSENNLMDEDHNDSTIGADFSSSSHEGENNEDEDDDVKPAGADDLQAGDDSRNDPVDDDHDSDTAATSASINADVNAQENNHGITVRRFFWSWRLIVIVLIFALAIGGPISWFKLILPAVQTAQANKIGNSKIVTYDHSWKSGKLNKELVDDLNVNETQYSIKYTDLTSDKNVGRSSSTACFVFKGSGSSPTHHAKAILSLGDDKSRNFLDEQASTLSYAMKKGVLSTEICLLLTSSEYSALATEALGEIDYNDPSFTWTAIKDLIDVDTSTFNSSDDMMKSILKTVDSLKDDGMKIDTKESSITNNSIKAGSFIQWARTMTNKNSVEVIPAFYLDDKNLSDAGKFNLYDPDVMYKRLNNLEN